MKRLSRSHLYLMATAKTEAATAAALLSKAAAHAAIVAPSGAVTTKLCRAMEAADLALQAVHEALEGQVEE